MTKANGESRRATIYDVAKAAGVSTATASRVLSGSTYPVNQATREKILAAAGALRYSPNLAGRTLKRSVSRDIGVVIPNISNPFYTELVLGAETAAGERGYGLLLCNSLRQSDREAAYLESLCQKQVGGIILSSVSPTHEQLRDFCRPGGLRMVALDQRLEDLPHGAVDFQVKAGVKMALRYLAGCGHRRIALLSSPPTVYSRRQALEGYREALAAYNLPHEPAYELISHLEAELGGGVIYEFENGRLLAERLLALPERPTAAFCANDMTAAGLLQRLSELSVSVPGDLSVMGFDNIALAGMLSPALATVDQSPYEAGLRAAAALIDVIEQGGDDPHITITPRLIPRASVRAPRKPA